MRIFDTPNLFGVESGVSTCGDFICAICETAYNTGNDAAENYRGDSVGYTVFAGQNVCRDCFPAIEGEILHRMPAILKWYAQIVQLRKKKIREDEKAISEILNSDS